MNQQILSYHVEARTLGQGASAATIKQTAITFDTSDGQSEVLPGPADLLTLAFAACVLKNVERFSRMLPFRYSGASIEVTSERQSSPPRITRVVYTLHIQTDEPAQRVDLLHRNIKKFGTIYNTLAASCAVDGEIVVEALQTVQQRAADDEMPDRSREREGGI